MKRRKKSKIERLDGWEWATLVASWRYFEYRQTIASASFPADIVSRFWGSGRYADAVLNAIANQFAYTDHGISGEADWAKTWADSLQDCDKRPWCKFYAFCKAWRDGFTTLTLGNGNKREARECFFCKFTSRWYPKNEYIENPHIELYAPKAFAVAETVDEVEELLEEAMKEDK